MSFLRTSVICPQTIFLLFFEITYLQELLSLLDFTSCSSFFPLFQPTFLLFDLGAAMSHHYHENDQDTCQDRVKKEFSANSRPWVDEKRELLLNITALSPRHTSGEWEELQLRLLPTVIQGNRRTGKY